MKQEEARASNLYTPCHEDLVWFVDSSMKLISSHEQVRYLPDAVRPFVAQDDESLQQIPPSSLWNSLYELAARNGSFAGRFELEDHGYLQYTLTPTYSDGALNRIEVKSRIVCQHQQAQSASSCETDSFHNFFQKSPLGLFRLTPEHTLLHLNPAMSTMLGYATSAEAMQSLRTQTHAFWFAEEESTRLFQQLNTVGLAVGFECRLRHKNGSAHWVSLYMRRISDARGKTLCFEACAEDIAARQQLHDELEARLDRQRRFFMDSSSIMLLIDAKSGEIVDANDAAASFYLYPRPALLGKNLSEITQDASEDLIAILTRPDPTERRYFNFLHRLANGEHREVEFYTSPLRVDDRDLLFAVVHDVSDRKEAERRQHELELRYRTAFQTSLDAMSICRFEDGMVIDVNQSYLDMFGFQREEILGLTTLELGIWVDTDVRQKMLDLLHHTSDSRDLEVHFRRKNGEIFQGLHSATRLELKGDPCILSVLRDISRQKTSEQQLLATAEALRASEERYRGAFQTSLDSFTLSYLENGLYQEVNPAFLQMMGQTRDEVIGHTSLELNHWGDPQDRERLMLALQQGESCRELEFEWRKKDGELFWVVISATRMDINGVPGMLAVIRDISSARAAAEEIRSLAFYDPLTHLPNRRLLLERLQKHRQLNRRTGHHSALLFIDLDNFKILNDTLGHQVGDMLLIEVAQRMTDNVRKSDTVGRLGGDEFVVLLEDLSQGEEEAAAQARIVGEKILRAIERPYLLGEHQHRCSASIGITIFCSREEDASMLLRQADIAMYQAKSEGRGNLRFFAPVLQTAVHVRAEMEEDLRQAILQQQFELYYQPQISDSKVVSCEALIRWIHPVRGMISPLDFIPLAEETGQILSLGNWVLATACDQLAKWNRRPESRHLCLSINISPMQFRQSGFINRVLEELRRSGADPKRLCLELTESTLLDSVDQAIMKIVELKEHGVRFSLDDFGTGYSSLSYLKRLPLDQLKIDRSFIQDILLNTSSGAIVKTIVDLAHAIGLDIVAEGVETREQLEFLNKLGCSGVQGYLYSPPKPLEVFESRWLYKEEAEVTATA